jgi:carboxyl-terminal processing protease
MGLRSRTGVALAAGVVLGFSVSLTGNVFADRPPPAEGRATAADALPWEDAQLLAEVMERVRKEYVDRVDEHTLMENAIRGMVSGLDPHSAFLDSDEYEDMRVSTTGSYPGVGIEVVAGEEGVKVLRPIAGSPAARAGILAGDLIVRIDGEPVGPDDLERAIDRMRGREGSTVELVLRRGESPQLIELALRREKVEVRSVAAATLEPGLGYVRITHFSETTPQDVNRALADLAGRTPRLRGLVLDLRNNPGGVLESGVEVADLFLDSGAIVSADGRTSDARFRMDATPGDALEGGEIVVLVNSGSASAAEIVAGALRDHRRAALIGRTTYGKGSVQTVMPLSRGRAIKITTSRYFTPSGESIQSRGIVPDVAFEGPDQAPAELKSTDAGSALLEQDSEVRAALDALKARIGQRAQLTASTS